MDTACKNCEQTLSVEYSFCPGCGQKADLHRLGWHDLVHEAIHYFTHADKGIFKLIIDLIKKPGDVARQYVDGKRKKCFPPLNFFLIVAAILVIASTWKQPPGGIDVVRQFPELAKMDDKERAEAQPFYERRAKMGRFTDQYSNIIAMGALPLSAFLFFLFYIRSRYNYVEHVVAGMYLIGFCLLVYAIMVALAQMVGLKRDYVAGVFLLFQIVYGAVFYYGFIEKGRKKRILLPVLASLTSVLVWIMFTMAAFGIYIRNGFWGWLA